MQLWRMSYPGWSGVALTNDLNSYLGADVDAARNSLVTSQSERGSRSGWVTVLRGAVRRSFRLRLLP